MPSFPTVPGAEHQEAEHLDDLTTAGTGGSGHTVPEDWAGLHPAGPPPATGVPGLQVDGFFPDTSSFNTAHGWDHDAQFVIRLPDRWAGGLVVSGAPGIRRQYANDRTLGDDALARGYAFASTDKGNSGPTFFLDGDRPGDAILEWHQRLHELTVGARAVVEQHYGARPRRTWAAGISNGAYLVRWALERDPELYDGGIDWEGTLWTPDGPNLTDFLPVAVRHYPVFADPDADPAAREAAGRAMIAAGFAPGSEPLWDYHHTVYWALTSAIFRAQVDPGYDGDDSDYDLADRPPDVREAIARISLTGRLQRPMITLHGTLDCLLPITRVSDVYADLVRDAGCGALHRYYRVEGGNHVDGLCDAAPALVRPLFPLYRSALDGLVAWVENGTDPPPSGTLRREDDLAGPRA